MGCGNITPAVTIALLRNVGATARTLSDDGLINMLIVLQMWYRQGG
jgi:hypothetical protein